MSDKPKFQRAEALEAVRSLLGLIKSYTERVTVAGSLRRCRAQVGDIEILYIPKVTTEPDGLFDTKRVNWMDWLLDELIKDGRIEMRLNSLGSRTWGPNNKLARHLASGIPIDFFQAKVSNWFNLLVCRTGSAANNIRLASAAQRKGWKWHPYGCGFTDSEGNAVAVGSEQDVFRLAGLPYLEPWER